MAEDNNGVAGTLANAFHDFISGDSFKQGLKDAWAKHFGGPAPSEHDKAVADMNKQANDQRVADANKSFLKPEQAATIRQKMSK
jgi:hypothetical protein